MARDPFRDLGKKIEATMKKAGVTGDIPLPELMPPTFIRRHTKFKDLQEMVDAAPGSGEAKTDTATRRFFDSRGWDRFVAENSSFRGWKEMLSSAANQRIRRKLK